jgi:radical SAM superfamily enzyme YgiQ (UPF0313 family)
MPQRRRVLLVQLPIPPLGPQPIRGNVPLAAGYLRMFAEQRGLGPFYRIDIFPPVLANTLSDLALVEAILEREPCLVGFTCYLWNIDRTLWLAARLKLHRPDLRIVLGGPEITADNAWVLESDCVDYAVIGEGEQTFADLLLALIDEDLPPVPIDGLFTRATGLVPRPRKPLAQLDVISSPYLASILDAADEEMLLLETIRGCVFKCKFCYYPKAYDALYFVSEAKIVANLEHARTHGAREVVLLDPTLNQRRDFHEFLRLLAQCNSDRQFTYFGELRGEGITAETARFLKEANFTEVEIGLQSIDPHAQELMDRKNNLRAFERGARAMLDLGIKVKVDLIIGLPGDTPDTIRQGFDYLHESGLYTDVQVFNLAILPGTAFRQEAAELGLKFQPRPPYYVLQTPTLRREEMFQLLEEAGEVFGMDWDPLPPPELDRASALCIDLDDPGSGVLPFPKRQAVTLWLQSSDFAATAAQARDHVERLLAANPFTTLQVLLEPTAEAASITPGLLDSLWSACLKQPTYLDRYYALQPGRPIGAKRLVVVLEAARRLAAGGAWLEAVEQQAAVVTFGAESSPGSGRTRVLERSST